MEIGFCERWLFNQHGDDLSMWVLPNEVTWTFRAFDILFVVTLRNTEVKCNHLLPVRIFTDTSFVNVQYFTVPKVKVLFSSVLSDFRNSVTYLRFPSFTRLPLRYKTKLCCFELRLEVPTSVYVLLLQIYRTSNHGDRSVCSSISSWGLGVGLE
jgi:hypothetical protein